MYILLKIRKQNSPKITKITKRKKTKIIKTTTGRNKMQKCCKISNSDNTLLNNHQHKVSAEPPREFWGSGAKEKDEAPMWAKRTGTFQGLEINFGKLLLVYFMRPPDLEAMSVMSPYAACGPGAICPPAPSWRPWVFILSYNISVLDVN